MKSISLFFAMVFLISISFGRSSQWSANSLSGKWYQADTHQIMDLSPQGIISFYAPDHNSFAIGVYRVSEMEDQPGEYMIDYGFSNIWTGQLQYEAFTITYLDDGLLEFEKEDQTFRFSYLGESAQFEEPQVLGMSQLIKNLANKKPVTDDLHAIAKTVVDISLLSNNPYYAELGMDSMDPNPVSGDNSQTSVQEKPRAGESIQGKWYAAKENEIVEFANREVFTSFIPEKSSYFGIYGVKNGRIELFFNNGVHVFLPYRMPDSKTLIITSQGEEVEYKYAGPTEEYSQEQARQVFEIVQLGVSNLSQQAAALQSQMMNQMHRTNMTIINNMGGYDTETYEIDQYGNKVRKW